MPEPVSNPMAAGEPTTAFTTPRLMSVDALRGFDMFWIIGAEALVHAFNRMSQGGAPAGADGTHRFSLTGFLADQFEHVDWAGFHFYDLIFPLFIFIMGVSLVFSLSKQIAAGGRKEALKRLTRRFVLLFIVALLYSGGFTNPWPDMRLLGVLNRIALCYFFGGLIFIFFKPKAMAAIAMALLVGYWALMNFVPIRDLQLENDHLAQLAENEGDAQMAASLRGGKTITRDGKNFSTNSRSAPYQWVQAKYASTLQTTHGKFEPGLNLANHFDYKYLPGKKWDVYWDPEGFLSTIPAIGTCLLGVFAGLLLRSRAHDDRTKLFYLFSFGIAAVILGFVWGLQFPVVKKIWTSSFVLVAGGYSAILMGIFYWMVDVMKWQGWCQPFVWMGMNSITIYVTSSVIGGFRRLAGRFVGGDVRNFFDLHVAKGTGDLLVAFVGLALAFWFVYFLYRRKIFLRL